MWANLRVPRPGSSVLSRISGNNFFHSSRDEFVPLFLRQYLRLFSGDASCCSVVCRAKPNLCSRDLLPPSCRLYSVISDGRVSIRWESVLGTRREHLFCVLLMHTCWHEDPSDITPKLSYMTTVSESRGLRKRIFHTSHPAGMRGTSAGCRTPGSQQNCCGQAFGRSTCFGWFLLFAKCRFNEQRCFLPRYLNTVYRCGF